MTASVRPTTGAPHTCGPHTPAGRPPRPACPVSGPHSSWGKEFFPPPGLPKPCFKLKPSSFPGYWA